MKPKNITFVATDQASDCLRCAFSEDQHTCGEPCKLAASKMGVAFTYAVLCQEPDREYYGG